MSDARTLEDKLDLWLVSGAERFRRDAELRQALLAVARHADSRRCLLLLNEVIEAPGLVDRLFEVLGGREAALSHPVRDGAVDKGGAQGLRAQKRPGREATQ
jgi:hypothetical protein